MYTYFQEARDFGIHVDTDVVAFICIVDYQVLLICITHREEVAAQFVFPSYTQIVILDIRGFVCQHIPPVGFRPVFISVQCVAVHQMRSRIPIRIRLEHIVSNTAFFEEAVCDLAKEPVASFGIHVFVGRLLVRERTAVFDCRFTHHLTRFGSDQDHTVAGFRSIDGGGACIFQDIDGFDIVHIDIDHVPTENDAVQNDQRTVTATDGRTAADRHIRIFTGFRYRAYVQSGNRPL